MSLLTSNMFYTGSLDQINDVATLRILSQRATRKADDQENKLEYLQEENANLKQKLNEMYQSKVNDTQPDLNAVELMNMVTRLQQENEQLRKINSEIAYKLQRNENKTSTILQQDNDYLHKKLIGKISNQYGQSCDKATQTINDITSEQAKDAQYVQRFQMQNKKIIEQNKAIETLQDMICKMKSILQSYGADL